MVPDRINRTYTNITLVFLFRQEKAWERGQSVVELDGVVVYIDCFKAPQETGVGIYFFNGWLSQVLY